MARKIGPFDPDHAASVRRSHEDGASVLALASRLEVSRKIVGDIIRQAGGEVRGRSSANSVRMAREGEAGRQRLTAAAHDARRGTKATMQEKVKRANRRSTQRGHGEDELLDAMKAAGLRDAEPQKPCGPYNIDIAYRTVAVELLKLPTAHLRNPAFRARCEYLADRGYKIVLVLFSKADRVVINAENVIRTVKFADRQPASIGHHWMVRCRLKRWPKGEEDRADYSVVETPIGCFNTSSSYL